MPSRMNFCATVFDPATMQNLRSAFAATVEALGLKDKDDDLKNVVAKKIIELAKAGERDPERLKAETLRSIRQ